MTVSDLLLLVVFGPALLGLGLGVLIFLFSLVMWILGVGRDEGVH